MEYVSIKKLDLAISRQFNKNIKEKGHSLSHASMHNKFSPAKMIIEIRDGYLVMQDGWRDFIKTL